MKIQLILKCAFCACMVLFATECKTPEYTLNVDTLPFGSGTVELSPLGGTYMEGTQVTLSPKPVTEYQFTRWSGTDSSSVSNNKINMSKNMELSAIFTLNSYTISASVLPVNSGTITGAGSYNSGQTVILTAIPEDGYTFTNWTENGTEVSTDVNYSFIATTNRTLVALFTLNSYTISASVLPVNSGTITGAGSCNYGQTVTLTATPSTGYAFVNWTENGTQVSTDATYSFVANATRTLVANLEATTQIRMRSGTGLNNGGEIYFAALSKNVDYRDLNSDEVFSYSKTSADWYIDGGIVPFTTSYKLFNSNPGTYYILLRASGIALAMEVTILSGKQSILVWAGNYGLIVSIIPDGSSPENLTDLPIKDPTQKVIHFKQTTKGNILLKSIQ